MPDTLGLLSQFYLTIEGMSDSLAQELVGDLLELTVESSLHLPAVATSEHPLFDGEIVEIEPDFRPGAQRFVLRAFDRMHRLSRGRKVRSFQNMTDSDLLSKVARELRLESDTSSN